MNLVSLAAFSVRGRSLMGGLLLTLAFICTWNSCVAASLFPEKVDSASEIKHAIAPSEVSDGARKFFLACTPPLGGGRIYVFFAVYISRNGGWVRIAEGMLDSSTGARMRIDGNKGIVEALYPGVRDSWETRFSFELPSEDSPK